MTLQDAIKSGLPFRRKQPAYSAAFLVVSSQTLRDGRVANIITRFPVQTGYAEPSTLPILTVEDLLATDWEAKAVEIKKTTTATPPHPVSGSAVERGGAQVLGAPIVPTTGTVSGGITPPTEHKEVHG